MPPPLSYIIARLDIFMSFLVSNLELSKFFNLGSAVTVDKVPCEDPRRHVTSDLVDGGDTSP